MISGIAAVALGLFEERGFAAVTVDDIASEAEISVRTFYRYIPTKEDLLLVMIRQRAASLAQALATRPIEENPLHSLRMAAVTAISTEDPASIRQWITVVAATPNILRTVMGANILELNSTIAEFLGSRLGMPSDALVPSTLAVAAGAVIQSAQTRWHLAGGDLAGRISEALQVLEEGIGADLGQWATAKGGPKTAKMRQIRGS
jgi:AcrR family transcriptional regulator